MIDSGTFWQNKKEEKHTSLPYYIHMYINITEYLQLAIIYAHVSTYMGIFTYIRTYTRQYNFAMLAHMHTFCIFQVQVVLNLVAVKLAKTTLLFQADRGIFSSGANPTTSEINNTTPAFYVVG
jgi:hypothetical protein